MTAELEIRTANAGDIAVISAIGHESFRKAYEESSQPDDLVAHLESFFSVAAIRGEMQLPGHTYLLALHGGVAAGFVKIRESARPDDIPASRALELQQLYVLPDQQRFGIGGRLIEAAARDAEEKAADGIWLSVWEEAAWAVSCYRKNGFEVVGTTRFQLGTSVYSDLLMWRPV